MQWLVHREGVESLVYTAELFIQKVLATKEPSDEHRFLGNALVEELQRVKTLSKMAPDELVTLALFIGYYYRVLIEQNEVEVKHVDSSEDRSNQGPL